MAFTPLVGISGRVKIAGTTVYLNKFEVDEQVDEIDVTNFESVGNDGFTYEQRVAGKRVANVTLSGVLDEGITPASLGLVAGATLANVLCYLDKGSATLYYGFTLFIVLGLTISEGVNEKEVKITIKGKSTGQYSYPS